MFKTFSLGWECSESFILRWSGAISWICIICIIIIIQIRIKICWCEFIFDLIEKNKFSVPFYPKKSCVSSFPIAWRNQRKTKEPRSRQMTRWVDLQTNGKHAQVWKSRKSVLHSLLGFLRTAQLVWLFIFCRLVGRTDSILCEKGWVG